MPWWGWTLVGWAALSVIVAPILGKLLKRNREQIEEEAFWKDQFLRSRSRWN